MEYTVFKSNLKPQNGESLFMPVKGAARSWICSNEKRALVVVPDERQAHSFVSDMKALFPGVKTCFLSAIPLEKDSVDSVSEMIRRGQVIDVWLKDGGLLVSTPGALVTPVFKSDTSLYLHRGKTTGRENLITWLDQNGYVRSDLVWRPGEFSVRGGIVDLYDPSFKMPVRVDFFDDDIDDLRFFSSSTQVTTYPVDELLLGGVSGGRRSFPAEQITPGIDMYLFDPVRISSNVDSYRWLWNDISETFSLSETCWDEFITDDIFKSVIRVDLTIAARQIRTSLREIPLFHGRLSEAKKQVSQWKKDGYRIILHTASKTAGDFLQVETEERPLSAGFVDVDSKVVILSDLELYGTKPDFSEDHELVPDEWDFLLDTGQWLVHEKYGICQYAGLDSIDMGSSNQEFIVLEFDQEKRLLLPVAQAGRLSPYKGTDNEDIKADTLGSVRWSKAMTRADEQIEREAQEMLELYASRETFPGRSFSPDSDMYFQFEDLFPHVETEDQLRAISDVKRDMESSRSMDRLIVGDVGYGKTEVALRAAFKAVYDGAQVAVIVPTTVLARQHFATFTSRMADFPVSVRLLSRFVSKKQQQDIIKSMADGSVDIVIGTHRLLQEDVIFKDLGLIIVDEEHRFGVSHKENLRKLQTRVDVLTLSATPIPRTLSMALKGLREISEIRTPPGNRPPVITVTGVWNEELVIKTIARELGRGGQVYFLNNLVSSIEERADWLRSHFPDFSVEIAHGQMKEQELERVMDLFYDGEVDILVCTTIIESGLDVGSANTLIVSDSRRLGLAQMHQLRGRVGRRSETAYALFLYPADEEIPLSTSERLNAIGRFTSRGSGYDLALKDLQIRGGGDFLGRSQHGHKERIGYSLYCRRLRDKIDELRGCVHHRVTTDVEIPMSIPSSYIPQPSIRMALYRRFEAIESKKNAEKMIAELCDRFGPVPPSVLFLINLAVLRTTGGKKGIIHVVISSKNTVVYVKSDDSPFFSSLWIRGDKNWIGPAKYTGVQDLVDTIC